MGKIFAILAAGAVAAGGGAYAVMHHLDPYADGGCPLARMTGCSAPVAETCPASDATTPVSAEVAPCCAVKATHSACCLEAAPQPASTLAAVVGPAAAVR